MYAIRSYYADEGYRIASSYLKENPDVKAIISGADVLATGVIMALKEEQLNGKVLLAGQDAEIQAIKNIVAGDMTMTIYKPIESLAYTAAFAALKITDRNNFV